MTDLSRLKGLDAVFAFIARLDGPPVLAPATLGRPAMKPFAMLALVATLATAGPAFAVSPGEAASRLRATISDLQGASPDYGSMTPAIAEDVRTHPEVGAQLAALGPVTVMVAVSKTNPFTFVVTFESGVVMNWAISFDAAGKINRLDATGK